MSIGPVNWMWGALTPLTPPPSPGPPPPARPVPPRNTWSRHATGTRRAHQWEIDRLADGVGEDASHAHAPLYPYLLGIHGTVWGFGLNPSRSHIKLTHYQLSCAALYATPHPKLRRTLSYAAFLALQYPELYAGFWHKNHMARNSLLKLVQFLCRNSDKCKYQMFFS